MLISIEVDFVGTISVKKKLKFISGPKPKFEKRLDSPKYFAKMGIHAKFEPIPTGSLFCEGYGFEKSPYHFLIRRFLYIISPQEPKHVCGLSEPISSINH